MTMTTVDGLEVEGQCRDGCLEGVLVGRQTGRHHLLVAAYHKGRPVGKAWRRMEGGGWIHSYIDLRRQAFGEAGLFIYPNLETCLVGTWSSGRLLEGREGRLVSLAQDSGRLLTVNAKIVDFSSLYQHSPSNRLGIVVDPLQREPFEQRQVEVRQSEMKNAGEGVFALRTLPLGSIACFYHGVYIEDGEESPSDFPDYQIFTDWQQAPSSPSLDILPKHWSINNYRASLGHKVNHSFEANCRYIQFWHPVFAHTCLAVVTMREVVRGEELTTNYRYDINESPDWFHSLYSL